MRLQQGHLPDLNDPRRGEFTATGDMVAGAENAGVSKSEVDYDLWNRLTGVEEPERLPGASVPGQGPPEELAELPQPEHAAGDEGAEGPVGGTQAHHLEGPLQEGEGEASRCSSREL